MGRQTTWMPSSRLLTSYLRADNRLETRLPTGQQARLRGLRAGLFFLSPYLSPKRHVLFLLSTIYSAI